MADEPRLFVIAPRQECLDALPKDWQAQVRNMGNIDVVGATLSRMQVAARPAALDQAREKLGHLLHFEEDLPRTP